jgi:hypothetical protein
MKTLIIAFVIFLSGCSIVTPVKRNFPEVPKTLQEKCEELAMLQGNSVTDLLRVVVENYQKHYRCEIKVDGWQDWHKEQKQIFDSVK